VDNRELAGRIEQGEAPVVIDVRTGMEFKASHIPGAMHLPTTRIPFRRKLLPADRDTLLVLTCEHGPRAQLAAGILRLLGFKRLELLQGHMSAWRKAKLPTES